jgi:hypothetical protein
MSDYDLTRLNTRSFEQLTQSLALKIIGPQVIVYGDGPDGGREATFNGKVNYSSNGVNWNGYGILQAKFRQKPDHRASKNADWAIQEVKKEFAKFSPLPVRESEKEKRLRICPDYYVFATNLSLSSVDKSGGKDKVIKLLNEYKKSYGLKDFIIWDGDQIARFLDDNQDIRTTYSAWVMPGDVLSRMFELLDLKEVSFIQTIQHYLECELLDDQFARLGQGGYTEAKNITLSSVFIDLPIENLNASKVAPIYQASLGFEDDFQIDDSQKTVNFLDMFFYQNGLMLKPSGRALEKGHDRDNQAGRLVLIGGPGQGKTTVGQFACQLLRASLLTSTGATFSPEVSRALKIINEMAEGLPSVNAKRYPLRIDLKHLAASLAGKNDDAATSVFDYLIRRISKRTNNKIDHADFRSWLKTYPWLLVLDGLDEVPASSNRNELMQAIRDFISVEAHRVDADLLVLATTRPQGYSDEFEAAFYEHITLAPLNADQALKYGQRLAEARHPNQPSTTERLTESLRRATVNDATVRLMQSPLQVTIMLALIEGGGEPPEQRWKLFSDYYDVIYRREKERGTSFSGTLGRYEPDIHWIHHRAGWLLQKKNAKAGSTDSKLSHEEFEEIVNERLLESGHEDECDRHELVQTIRLAATDRLVLLVGNTQDEIGFEIRSLQEFMAAEHFFDGGEHCVSETLHSIASYPYWRNVFLFAAGRVFFQRQELKDCLIAVCTELNDPVSDRANQFIRAGSRLALALLKDGAARNQPTSLKILARSSAGAMDALDGDVISLFEELYSGECEPIWTAELEQRLNSKKLDVDSYKSWELCLRLPKVPKIDVWIKNFFPTNTNLVNDLLTNLHNAQVKIPAPFLKHITKDINKHAISDNKFIFNRNLWENKQLSEIYDLTDCFQDAELDEYPVISSTTHSDIGLAFRVHGKKSLELFSKGQFPDDFLKTAHWEWHILAASKDFSKNATLENLISLVEKLSRIVPENSTFPYKWYYPWQVSICLTAYEEGLGWSSIVEKLSAKYMGNEKDWDRWSRKTDEGVQLSSCRTTENQLEITDKYLGNLFRISGWSYSAYSRQAIECIREITSSLERYPDLTKNTRILELACRSFSRAGFESTELTDLLEHFVNLSHENNFTVHSQLVNAALLVHNPIPKKISILKKIGSLKIIYSQSDFFWGDERDFAAQLKEVISELPKTDAAHLIIRSISYLAPNLVIATIPMAMLQICSHKGDSFKKAAKVLELYSLQWLEEDAAGLVDDVFALLDEYPSLFYAFYEFIDSEGWNGKNIEEFLIAVINSNRDLLTIKLIYQTRELLVKMVERRPALSKLPDPLELRNKVRKINA